MIPIGSSTLYAHALDVLRNATGPGFRGRAAQIFLACKHYGGRIPTIGSAVGVDIGQMQALLDDLYIKPNRSTPDKVAIIFDADHKVPSGVTAGGLKGPSNIWRNNLNLQKGFICFAPSQLLLDPAFQSQSRKLCPHLRPSGAKTLANSWCAVKAGAPGGQSPRYRGEDNPKMFRKDPVTDEYTVHDPRDVTYYSSIMLPANGAKLPIAALIVALYHDSVLAAGRSHVDLGDFLTDFGFTTAEASAYFDDDPASAGHRRLASAAQGISWTRLPALVPTIPPTLPGLQQPPPPRMAKGRRSRTPTSLAGIVVTTSPTAPIQSGWWDAQQAVRTTLEAAGWTVQDASMMQAGFDLQATKAGTVKAIEVKSSVGICTPTLTRTERATAIQVGSNYVLAIVENFVATAPVTIQWVHNPARLQMTEQHVVQYTLPRSIWRKHTSAMP